jgi:hypothetical protein
MTGLRARQLRNCSTPGKGKRFFSTSERSHQLWGPSSLLLNGCLGLFKGRGVKLSTHPRLVRRLQMCGATAPVPHMPSWRAQGHLYTMGRQTDASFAAFLISLTLVLLFYGPLRPSVLFPVTLKTKGVEVLELLMHY